MIRIAAAGDVHFDRKSHNRLAQHFQGLHEKADVLLLAGDLTQTGHPEEMKVLAEDLKKCPIPIVAVLGNHDYHVDQVETVTAILKDVGVGKMQLLANPRKMPSMTGFNLEVTGYQERPVD